MRKITFRQIEAFQAVMLTGSMSGAADLLGLTQPAVSRSIRDFEGNINLPLFIRKGNSVEATPEADVLFKEIEAQFAGLDRIIEVAGFVREAKRGTLRVAGMLATTTRFLPTVLAKYLELFPHARVSLQHAPSPTVLEIVANRRADIGFCYTTESHPGVDVEVMPTLPAYAVLPVGHPLANSDTVHVDQLAEVPLLSLGSTSVLWRKVEGEFSTRGRQPIVACESLSAESLCSLAALGLGVAVVDPFTAFGITNPKIVVRPILPLVEYAISIILPKRDSQPRPVKQLASLIRSEMAAMRAARIPPEIFDAT